MTLEEESRDSAEVLHLVGEADLAAVPAIQGKLREKMKSGVDLLIIDFSQTTFVNTPVWALVVRLEGNNVDAGKATLASSGLNLVTGDDLADAAKKVVASLAA